MTILKNLTTQRDHLLFIRDEVIGDIEYASRNNEFDGIMRFMELLGRIDNDLNKITAQIKDMTGVTA